MESLIQSLEALAQFLRRPEMAGVEFDLDGGALSIAQTSRSDGDSFVRLGLDMDGLYVFVGIRGGHLGTVHVDPTAPTLPAPLLEALEGLKSETTP